ncbi:MAG: regulatory signaling modulator protein AmpE [Gammaproteobacteria bacterium]|nr:regulatory signaling modulator protein AmpE [Gammaproteobacteria bacterium]
MALISIIISLMLDHSFRHFHHFRDLSWFERYSQKIGLLVKTENSWLKLLIILALPVLLIALLQLILFNILWGIPVFLLSIPVLFYCLGPDCLINDIEAYLDARSLGDDEEALHYTAVLTGRPASPSPDQQTTDVTRAILNAANERVFSVLFWFVLLGPLGAVLYHLIANISQQDKETEALRNTAGLIQSGMAWAPARILSIGYALTGHFDGAIHAYRGRPHEDNIALANYDVLISTGLGALRHQKMTDEISCIRSARSLVTRSILIWVAVLALLTLGGWLG